MATATRVWVIPADAASERIDIQALGRFGDGRWPATNADPTLQRTPSPEASRSRLRP